MKIKKVTTKSDLLCIVLPIGIAYWPCYSLVESIGPVIPLWIWVRPQVPGPPPCPAAWAFPLSPLSEAGLGMVQ